MLTKNNVKPGHSGHDRHVNILCLEWLFKLYLVQYQI